MNFKAAIIQHEDSTPPGSILEWLESFAVQYKIHHLGKSSVLPDLESFDMLIVCGGSMNVDEESRYSWMKSEKQLILSAIKNNKLVIGLCLGSQLIAEVLGAEVKQHSVYEVGWQKVELLKTAEFDLGESLMVYQWHGYTFEVPKGGKLIATNSACKNQAFTFGRNVIAFQFHPEATKEWVIECANSEKIPIGLFCQTKDQMIVQMQEFQPLLQKWFFKTLNLAKSIWLS